jgi:lipopolysaccharide transport system permease protein
MLAQTTRNDVRARYAGSTLGLAWLVFYPMLFLSAYAVIFQFVYKVRPATGFDGPYDYLAMIFCGLISFIGFSEALTLGVGSVTGNASLIKNTLFPIELIPVKAVLTSQCTQLVGTALLFVALGFLHKLSVWALLFPIIWALQIMLSIGLVWILSSLNVFLRDLQNIVALLVLVIMMVSPISYTEDMIPEGYRPLLAINPMYYLIISYQDCLTLGRFPRGNIFWTLLILAPTIFVIGYWFFSRMKRVFADNV